MQKFLCMALLSGATLAAQPAADLSAGRAQFEARCSACHGGDGKGGPRAPDIVTPGMVQERDADEVRKLVKEGLPGRGMPGFAVPEPDLTHLVAFYLSLTAPAIKSPVSGDSAAGRKLFLDKGCANCHTRSEQARVIGPDLSSLGTERTLGEIEDEIRNPSGWIIPGYRTVEAKLQDGSIVKGFARNQSQFDLQLQTFDGRFEFFDRSEIASLSEPDVSLMPKTALSDQEVEDLVAYLSRLDGKQGPIVGERELPGAVTWRNLLHPNKGDWPTYNGRLDGNRHSSLDQISPANVAELRPAWSFPIEAPRDLEMTPVVVDGVMYVTTVNKIHALDAERGRELWTFERPQTPGVMGDAGTGANRGVAVMGDKVFFETDNAHLIAVDRLTGRLVWETVMADFHQHYGGTVAPLVVKDTVIGGVAGGDEGIRGFVAGYDVNTGEEKWRFWTVPLPGEPLSESWKGTVLPHGCAGTWLTGTYDPELDTLYWPAGNPCPDMNGDQREGDNLYSDSMLAFDPATGKLKWHYQYTPHDEFDWDANQTPILADIEWQGRPRKVLLHANRNGFFYVLDRVTGEVLLGKPFVDKLTWASGIGADGRPILVPGKRPTYAGNVVCPGIAGATNWPSKAYSPETGLYYVQATEYCNTFTKNDEEWEQGKGFGGGAAKRAPGDRSERYLRALDPTTGEVKWEILEGDGGWRNWAGVMATANGLVFYGDDSGAFAAVSAVDGKPLWRFQANVRWRASPMTYLAGGKQFIAIGAGRNVTAFALPD